MKKPKSSPRKPPKKTHPTPKTVDEYFARVPESSRTTLNKMHATIRSAVPKVRPTTQLKKKSSCLGFSWLCCFLKHRGNSEAWSTRIIFARVSPCFLIPLAATLA